MRFFTSMTSAGRAEYFLVGLVLNFLTGLVLVSLVKVEVDVATQTLSWAADKVALGLFLYAGILYLAIINVLRRLKDLNMGSGLVAIMLIPIVNIIFQLFLLLTSGVSKETYTPYGDNPYDPDSWVPPVSASGSGPSVSYQGQELFLPGDEERAA